MSIKNESWITVGILTAIFLCWVLAPFILNIFLNSPEQRGMFGDSYGALNSLFSGLAFAGVIIAILLQRKELILQREELALTRAELKRSASAHEESGNYLGEQSQVLKVTAELNGLASLIQARSDQIQYLYDHATEDESWKQKIEILAKSRDRDIEQLELLMHGVFSAAEHNAH